MKRAGSDLLAEPASKYICIFAIAACFWACFSKSNSPGRLCRAVSGRAFVFEWIFGFFILAGDY